jgi:hypothetical protein
VPGEMSKTESALSSRFDSVCLLVYRNSIYIDVRLSEISHPASKEAYMNRPFFLLIKALLVLVEALELIIEWLKIGG